MVSSGNRVVFDSEGSYAENKKTGEWVPLEEHAGVYILKVWIPRNQKSPF